MKPAFNLGAWRRLNGSEGGHALWLPAEHLVTHGVVVGMTGSGKTGLITVMIEELQRSPRKTLYRSRETTPAGIALSGCGWRAIGAARGAVRSKGQQRVFRRLEGEGEPVALDGSGEVEAAVDSASRHEGGRGELALVRTTSEQLGLRE